MEFTVEDKKMRLTPLQAAMLKKIATDEMTCVNGAEPESIEQTETWDDGIIETAQDKGVFTSLLNARLVSRIGKGRDSTQEWQLSRSVILGE